MDNKKMVSKRSAVSEPMRFDDAVESVGEVGELDDVEELFSDLESTSGF